MEEKGKLLEKARETYLREPVFYNLVNRTALALINFSFCKESAEEFLEMVKVVFDREYQKRKTQNRI